MEKNSGKESLNIGNSNLRHKARSEEEQRKEESGGKEKAKRTDDSISTQTNNEKKDGELADDELEEIVGGLTSVVVPICTNCQKRVAVYQMRLCAVCFLKLK
jgi:hypothetical protein